MENLRAQRAYFESGATRSLEFRLQQLAKLEDLIKVRESAIAQALHDDLRKPPMEAFTTEITVLLEELRHTKKYLGVWMDPQTVFTPVPLMPAKSVVYREPLGVVLILSPWNYPFQLAIAPLVGAIAAGNCAVIKPSEIAPHTAKLLHTLVSETFAPEYIQVAEGGVSETTALLKNRFDHIFFTGSAAVGKVVLRAAAEHLTPVTLELGGKSPVIVTPSADLDIAARRITWGKFMNAGQTCVAPDYVCAHEDIVAKLIGKIQENIKKFYSEDPQSSPSYARIVNAKNFDRLKKSLNGTNIFCGGESDKADLYLAPTVLSDVGWNDEIMQEEIFGPILPVLKFGDLNDTFGKIRQNPKPLSAYFFSLDDHEVEMFLRELSFGGGCVNDTVLHLADPRLPFGGVGASGMGAYHGEQSFAAFSHRKSVLHKSRFLDFAFRYPPFKDKQLKILKRFFGL